jgi:hypothetical protein
MYTPDDDIVIDDDNAPTFSDDSDALVDFGDTAASGANGETGSKTADTDDDSTDEFGKKVQKRINKLVRERNIERDQRVEMKKEIDELKTRLSQFDQEKAQKEQTRQLAELNAQKAELYESGEYDKIADIDEQIFDLKIQSRDKKPPEQTPRPQAKTEQQAEIPEAQLVWMDKNDWYHNPRKAQQAQEADAAYLQLVNKEGYDPEDDETYAELDRRLASRKRTPAPSPGSVDRGAVSDARPSSKFSQDDARKMRNWGLDPHNAEQRAEYLRNRRA